MTDKGWIALDIDGTITEDKYSIPVPVVTYLKSLTADGWKIVFATGRSYKFAMVALSSLDFPYFLLPQNGSVVLKMPEVRVIEKNYIDVKELTYAEGAVDQLDCDCLVYAGFEAGDSGFYRPSRFSPKGQAYIDELQRREKERWTQLETFNECELFQFPLLKYFGSREQMEAIESKLSSRFHVTKIKDPFYPDGQLLLVTAKHASKGLSLSRLIEREGRGAKVIAAGDDNNDLSLFDHADVKIAMPHAPKILLENANIIAPPTAQFGIISALTEAIAR